MAAPPRTRRIVVADDEPLARARVRMLLAAGAGYEIVAECGDGRTAVDAIVACQPDILLLDIRMPGLDGFEVLAALDAPAVPPAVVFMTAYDSYAVRAFEVAAVDYLMKPFDADRLGRALARAELRLAAAAEAPDAGPAPNNAVRALLEQLLPRPGHPDRFLVRAPNHMYFVRAADVEWVDAAANYVRLHVAGRVHLVRDTMRGMEEKLPPDRFVRVHRSAIVNLDQVQRLEPWGHGEYVITLRDGTRLNSSRAHSERLRALLR